ncbi:MAG: aconitate hydratase AcnA [Chloroflexota bacterium]|nr:aconitate hydratase AcnA [Chloroflexota bacterium]MDE2941418.1 aconitate hydratase AcnA [Chloroflexota bacterium]
MSQQNLRQRSLSTLQTPQGEVSYFRLAALEEAGLTTLANLPFSIRVLAENALRNLDGYLVNEEDIAAVAGWQPGSQSAREFPFMPARVLMQDLTGVPAVVDLAAMRSAMAREGGDYRKVNPIVPVDLVIDHSVQVDYYGVPTAFQMNVAREFERNQERYTFLRWAQSAFDNFTLVPPGTGIVHQVNLEYLASVVSTGNSQGLTAVYPDTLVGTDSHTTMINGLSVLGWGVGGIEAEAVVLGQPYYMQIPEVIGFHLSGSLQDGVTATDLVLTVVQMLRAKGVVEKFVEFYGPGLASLPLPDRATIANMAPEYGATCGFFPIDSITLDYMRGTGRDAAQVELVEQYARAQGLFLTADTPEPSYTDTLRLDMSDVAPSLAGPRRPHDRVVLGAVRDNFRDTFGDNDDKAELEINGQTASLGSGDVVIAAITSCTNTSNPSVMIGSGLIAKKAVERGLRSKPWVKTSLAPGSQVVTDYMNSAGLTPYLEELGFQTVGYGCTTCIGNSGPLPDAVSRAVGENDLTVAAVLSGNRNFEGRVHADVKANYLASPMLVVAYALAGTVDIDLNSDPLGQDAQGNAVYLSDLWPSQEEIRDTVSGSLNPDMFKSRYSIVSTGPEEWQTLPTPEDDLYQWDPDSTYIQEVPFFANIGDDIKDTEDITGARVLVMLGDSVTTDHISPAGAIPASRPAGRFLAGKGVEQRDFNTFGSRRGNHEVLMRGTFGNIRLRNRLTPEREGDWTVYFPENEETSIFEAGEKYQANGIPTIIIAGKEYGQGSSRDWAAKGPNLLGVHAVISESFERIHRSNLIGMGVLPLQFKPGDSADSLGLTGRETFDVTGIAGGITPGQDVQIHAAREDSSSVDFSVTCRIDNQVEVDYHRNGGVLHTVLRRMLREG